MAFRYHLSLWLANFLFFLALDFSKRVGDLLQGLSYPELAVNAGLVLLVATPLAFLIALASWGLERVSGMRVVHAAAIFTLVTINLWSLKLSMARNWEAIHPGPRQILALLTLLFAVAFSCYLGGRMVKRSTNWQAKAVPLIAFWVTLLLLCLCGGLALTPKPPLALDVDKPSVILVTMDALSAKHTSLFGYQRQTTPSLAKLAAQSVVFERMHSNFNVTHMALPSLMGYFSHQPDGKNLPQCLQDSGYNTAFFSFWPPKLFGLPGFSHFELTRSAMEGSLYRVFRQYFSDSQLRWMAGLGTQEWRYFNPYLSEYHDDIFWRRAHYPPQLSLQAALDFLRAHPRGAFVWVHLWPPHFPYYPEPDTLGKFGPGPKKMEAWINDAYEEDRDSYVASLMDLYDECVYGVDRRVGGFIEQLKAMGLYDTSYLILGADHGESFERGWVGHSGWPLMEAVTHVPLVIHRPTDRKEIRVQTLAQQLDLAPTVLDMLGLPKPPQMRGESLVPYIEQPDRLSEHYKFSISLMALTGQGGQMAVFWKTFKLIFLSTDRNVVRLYNLFEDPEAGKDIAKENPHLVEEMMKRLVLPAGP